MALQRLVSLIMISKDMLASYGLSQNGPYIANFYNTHLTILQFIFKFLKYSSNYEWLAELLANASPRSRTPMGLFDKLSIPSHRSTNITAFRLKRKIHGGPAHVKFGGLTQALLWASSEVLLRTLLCETRQNLIPSYQLVFLF
jgi:hypothetical protein